MQPIDGFALLRSHRGLMAYLADQLKLSRPAVIQWQRVPAELLPAVEQITGIPRWSLRPDICPPPAPFEPLNWQPPKLSRRARAAGGAEPEPESEPAAPEPATPEPAATEQAA